MAATDGYVEAKLGRMRKAQRFHVSPMSDGRLMVQSDRSIGVLDFRTGEGRLCVTGCYFPHLALARPFSFPADFVRECLAACPALDSETVLAGGAVIIANTVQVIGGDER